MLVGGDDADPLRALLARLGMDAAPESEATGDLYDAAVWLSLDSASRESLLNPTALDRTAAMMLRVRPLGAVVLINRVGTPGEGHLSTCLDQHLAAISGRTRLTTFADLTPGALGRPTLARPGIAVATLQRPARGSRIARPLAHGACCEWAVESRPASRAA